MSIVVPTIATSTRSSVPTSGTLGEQIVDTMTVVEHAVRRCGKSPSVLTVEQLEAAKTNLRLILSALSNRGVNLWAVDQEIVPLVKNQHTYPMPYGTERILEAVYRSSQRLPGTSVLGGAPTASTVLPQTAVVSTIGFKFNGAMTGSFILEVTNDGTAWFIKESLVNQAFVDGWNWYDVDPGITCRGVRIRETGGAQINLSDMMLVNTHSELPLSRMNRNDYASQSTRSIPSARPYSFMYDKQIDPAMTIWPTPTDDEGQIVIWRQRRIQDVGTLAQRLEVPDRWLEAITWALSKNMAFELPEVAPDRIQLCKEEAAKALADAELSETDDSPFYLSPNISGYTR